MQSLTAKSLFGVKSSHAVLPSRKKRSRGGGDLVVELGEKLTEEKSMQGSLEEKTKKGTEAKTVAEARVEGFMLHGSRGSGRTSILFEVSSKNFYSSSVATNVNSLNKFAKKRAREHEDGRVLFICEREKVYLRPPLPVIHAEKEVSGETSQPLDEEVLKRIHMQYVTDKNDLSQCLGEIHNTNLPIKTLLVDDFDVLCKFNFKFNKALCSPDANLQAKVSPE